MKNVLTWLWRLLLLLLLLGITLLWLVETNSGARSLIGLLNTFTNTQVQYTNLNGTLGKLNIDELRVITDEQSVEIKKLSLNWQPYQAIFNSNITIDSLLADTVNIRINESSLDEQTQRSKDLRLPMNMDISNAQFNNVTFVGRDLGEIKRLSVSAKLDKNSWLFRSVQLDHARITANISGEFEPFDNFSHDVKLEFSSQETGTGNLNAIGNSKVSNLDLNLRLHQATVSAEISEWLTNPNYSLTGRLDSENILGIPVAFSFNAKGNQQQGNVQLDGKISGQQVKLDKLMYLVRNNSYSLDVAGIVSGAPLKLNTDFTRSGIENSELSWAPVLSSKNVRVSSALTTASGPWQNLDIQLKADAEINNHPAKLQLNSILKELGSLSIKPSRLSFLDGQIEFHGGAETSPTTALQVQGKIAQVHLEKIDPRLPQLDSGNFILVWNSQTGNTQLSSSISDLRAKVSKKQLTGNAELKMHNNQISMANLFLQADPENHIDLNLLDTKQQLLGIKIHINQLGSFIHEARGSIKGQIKLGLADRSADGELEISELSIPELISLNQASIIADNSNNHQDLAITANQVRIRELDILKLDLGLIGTQEKHALDASLLLENERSISLQGEGRRSRQNYHLFIQQLTAQTPETGSVINLDAFEVMLKPNAYTISPFCLSADLGQLCGNIEKSEVLSGKLDLKLEANDTTTFKPSYATVSMVPKASTIVQSEFRIANGQIKALALQAQMQSLAVRNQDDESMEISNIIFNANGINDIINYDFTADLAGGNILSNGKISKLLSDANIDALIRANLPNLEKVSPLLVSTDIRSGEFQTEMQLSGTLKAPRLSGKANLKNTLTYLPELAVSHTLDAEITMPDHQNAEITGRITSGTGHADLRGSVEWIKSPQVTLNISGNDLLLADLKNLSVSASPELSIFYAPGKLDINGNVNINRSFSGLSKAGSSSQLSNDVIILDAEGSGASIKTSQIRNISVDTEFINPARIEGYGLQGALSGKLRISQDVSGPVLGNGQLKITGSYKAFGHNLNIDSGNLTYVNSTLDNPYIEFYASRQIADVKVGVRVTGRPDRLLSRLESTPTMRESDILSYLVLGRPPGAASEDESNRLANAAVALALSRSESGIQTIADRSGLSELSLTQELGGLALNVGKQLSPRLFIGYSMGFIEPVNVAKIRYMLSSKWIIESEVSEETRALLKYRFERD